MAEHGLMKIIMQSLAQLCLLAVLLFTAACSAQKQVTAANAHLIKESMPYSPAWRVPLENPPREPSPPGFVSVTDEIVPLKTKMVNIVVRNSPLGDILHVLANASGLNLMVEAGVPIDQPMTLSLKNISAEDAMRAIFSSVDCFYTIDKNVLRVHSVSTQIFELGHPALSNTYSMDVGGDILSASAAGGMKGTVTSGNKSDGKAFDFLGSLEASLTGIMEKQDAKSKSQQSISINRMTGTIMVTASRKNIEKVERYLDNVRKVLSRQVVIEARIIEVQLSDELKFGIDWAFLKNVGALNGSVSGGFGALSLANSSLNDIAATADSAKFRVGLARTDFQTLLTALNTQGNIKTLSNPKINVMNGHASILTVGTNTSFISKVTTTTTATAAGNSISFIPETTSVLSGMIIGIVPYISEGGDISLNITPITSDLVNLQDKTFGTAGNQVTITIPTVALREMTTTVKMRDGQMVIIGGLISKKESSNEEKVPIIGDIPYLGKLFTRINNTESRSELVLLLRPHIVEND